MSIIVMKQALEALEIAGDRDYPPPATTKDAITSLRQAIAEAENQKDIFQQLGNQSMLQLWQNYCDVKVERAELQEKLAEAEKPREPLTDAELDALCPAYDDPMRQEMWKIGYRAAHGITSDMKQEPVDKTAKQRHEENT